MSTESKTHRTEKSSALCTEHSVGAYCCSDNTNPRQRNSDALTNRKEFADGLLDNTKNPQETFGKKCVPYQINNCHLNHNCRLCLKFNPFHSMVSLVPLLIFEIIK